MILRVITGNLRATVDLEILTGLVIDTGIILGIEGLVGQVLIVTIGHKSMTKGKIMVLVGGTRIALGQIVVLVQFIELKMFASTVMKKDIR